MPKYYRQGCKQLHTLSSRVDLDKERNALRHGQEKQPKPPHIYPRAFYEHIKSTNVGIPIRPYDTSQISMQPCRHILYSTIAQHGLIAAWYDPSGCVGGIDEMLYALQYLNTKCSWHASLVLDPPMMRQYVYESLALAALRSVVRRTLGGPSVSAGIVDSA